jgi:putative tricarboxylic transport membrane protein
VLVETWFSRVVLLLALLALVVPLVLRAVRGPRPTAAELGADTDTDTADTAGTGAGSRGGGA